jgi:2-polyprenyl-6-methoxyphenol hydroxylase-like FAD-dependent oxidoreductase
MRLRERSTPLVSIDFESLAKYTRYPFGLLLPQNITERVLTEILEDLGVKVLRPRAVTGIEMNEQDSSLVNVSFDNGRAITTRYVVGADGARSTVRTLGQFLHSSYRPLCHLGSRIGWHWIRRSRWSH